MGVENSVRDFVSDTPGADYDAIVDRFGTPEQITASYLEEMDGQELVRELNSRRKIVRIALTTAVIMVFLWAAVVFSELAEHNSRSDSFFVEEIVYVTEISTVSGG